MSEQLTLRTADVDRQLTLLRLAARVDPNLRQAVADVEDAIDALRTQLEQAQASADEWKRREGNVVDFGVELQERVAVLEARETALKEALAEIEKYADSFLNTHLDHYSLREISKQAGRALSGEQGKTI